jgi:selenium metabolism protein YedF
MLGDDIGAEVTSMKAIDCRGLACPAPVLQTKDAVERDSLETIRVVVDNEAAKQNVSRFLETQNFQITVESANGNFHVIGERAGGTAVLIPSAKEPDTETKKIVVLVATDRMGRGDDELGTKLMMNFIKTLKEMGDELWRLVFLNNGVKLTVTGSEALPVIQELAHAGTSVLVCGTCLDHFDLLDEKQVGETTNMLDIVTAMQLADTVINI